MTGNKTRFTEKYRANIWNLMANCKINSTSIQYTLKTST
jgi:hypothetical protein